MHCKNAAQNIWEGILKLVGLVEKYGLLTTVAVTGIAPNVGPLKKKSGS